jgi:hypothetical protein
MNVEFKLFSTSELPLVHAPNDDVASDHKNARVISSVTLRRNRYARWSAALNPGGARLDVAIGAGMRS